MIRSAWVPLAALVTGCSWGGSVTVGETRHDRQSIELGGAESARVSVDMGSGELRISGGAAALMDGDFTYNVEKWKPVVDQRTSGGQAEIRITQEDKSTHTIGNAESKWDVRLNDRVAMDVNATLGAGEAHLDLRTLNLRGVDMNIGAGEVHVDLRGMPRQSYSVHIKGGVGEAEVNLPRTVGITATASGGLGSIDVNGLEQRGDRWVNPGHERDSVQITVDVQGGVGEIRLNAE